jgi:hypothetical protein
MLLTTDWQPWFSYAWWNDIGVPALGAVGSIAVGAGAIVVAYRSHNLAERVRGDEQKRESNAARERYRDQLFRTLEPAIAATLKHRAELFASKSVRAVSSTVLFTNVVARLNLLAAVADDEDQRLVAATQQAYGDAQILGDWNVLADVATDAAINLADLLDDFRYIDDLVSEMDASLREAVDRHVPLDEQQGEPPPSSPAR